MKEVTALTSLCIDFGAVHAVGTVEFHIVRNSCD